MNAPLKKEEGTSQFDDKPEPFTMQAIMEKPCDYFPIFFFQCAGWIGFFTLCIAWSGVLGVGTFASLVLILTGVWAAKELRSLGTLSEQIKWLRRISAALSSECDKLKGEVTELSDETQELKQNTEDLRAERGELTASMGVFSKQNSQMRDTEQELRKKNDEVHKKLESLRGEQEQLVHTIGDMQKDGEETKSSLGEFSKVQEALQSSAEDQNHHLHEIIEQRNRDFNRMNELAKESDELLFWKRFYAIRRRCGENMSARHFKRFAANLRSKFGGVMREKGLDFEKLDKDGDGILDHQELTQFIDTLLDANWEKEDVVTTNAHEEMV